MYLGALLSPTLMQRIGEELSVGSQAATGVSAVDLALRRLEQQTVSTRTRAVDGDRGAVTLRDGVSEAWTC